MNELPDLPFAKVLSYLDLADRIKYRTVSRRWCEMIDNIRVSSLFFSEWPNGHVINKNRLVVGEFVPNYISTGKFEWFFGHFSGSLLSRLVHLRVCDLVLKHKASVFITIVNSFGDSLERLDLVRVEGLCPEWNEGTNLGMNLGMNLASNEESNLTSNLQPNSQPNSQQNSSSNDIFELNLPNLQRIRLEHSEIRGLKLNTSRLVELKAWYLAESRLEIVHSDSLESVMVDKEYFEIQELKNLQFFYCRDLGNVGDTLLADLGQLKEIHLNGDIHALERLHEQKRRYRGSHLKIFYMGLESADYDRMNAYLTGDFGLTEMLLERIISNYSTLAAELPLYQHLDYSEIEPAFSRVPTEFWARLTNLEKIYVNRPVRNVEHFLSFLRTCDRNVRTLTFYRSQPDDLFDQLPAHCQTVQFLEIYHPDHSNFSFLLDLPNLIDVFVAGKIELRLVRQIFETLKFIRGFWFLFAGHDTFIKLDRSKQLSLRFQGRRMLFADLDALFLHLNSSGRR